MFGSRALDRSLIGTRQPWRREQGGRVFNLLVRLATGLPFWDTQCGFKALQMDVCRPLVESMTIDRFAFDVEMIYIAQLAGAKLLELPVRWDHNDGSKVHVVRDSLLMVNEMLRVRRHERAGAYIDAVAEMKAGIAAQSGATAILKSAGSTESETDVRTAGAHV